MRIKLLRFVLRCSCLFLIMTGIITVSVYEHSRDHSNRDSNSPSFRPSHVIVEMKQYQQSYNSTPGPTTVDTHIKNQNSKEDHVLH